MTARTILLCAAAVILAANGADAARYQKTKDGKTLVWNSLRGVAQDVTWTGARDPNGYATGQGTLTWYRLGGFVNSYTGKMVRGKFEGPVIREQGNTRLQANFVNGEKAGGWSEPGSVPEASASISKSPTPNKEIEQAEKELTESPTPSPSPSPTATVELPSPTPTPTPTPIASTILSPTPTPRILASPSPTPTPKPSPTPTAAATPITLPKPSPTPMPHFSPLPTPTSTPISSAPIVEAPVHSLELATAPPQQQKAEPPRPNLSPVPNATGPNPPISGGQRKIDPVVKRQIIAEFQKQISFVMGQVKDATANFRPVDRLDQVKPLPAAASSHVTLLANQARVFRAQLGFEVTFYECLNEIQAVDSLVSLDEATRDIAAKDTPTARKNLGIFRSRYSEPTSEAQKPLWRYLSSLYSLCDRLKTEAEGHLTRAHSLESEGKTAEALREYREISRIYPNAITTEKIRQLESRSP